MVEIEQIKKEYEPYEVLEMLCWADVVMHVMYYKEAEDISFCKGETCNYCGRFIAAEHPTPAPQQHYIINETLIAAIGEWDKGPHDINKIMELLRKCPIDSTPAPDALQVLDELYEFVDGLDPDFIIRERISIIKSRLLDPRYKAALRAREQKK